MEMRGHIKMFGYKYVFSYISFLVDFFLLVLYLFNCYGLRNSVVHFITFDVKFAKNLLPQIFYLGRNF